MAPFVFYPSSLIVKDLSGYTGGQKLLEFLTSDTPGVRLRFASADFTLPAVASAKDGGGKRI